ncbi:carbohydrate ABC transporter permease [Allofournierella sp.]|uniref:carbohydrate ABC transporter permease n=1 Tax=Allofournierella sp. TaxID=1940256 RepID=UPI003AB73A28
MRKKFFTVLAILLAVVVCLWAVFPFAWILSTSFKPAREIYTAPSLIPKAPTLDGYANMLFGEAKQFNFREWLFNSVFVSLCTTLFSLVIASLGGYGISRFRFRGRKALAYVILMTQVLPGSLLIIPLYIIMNALHLINTLWALILAYTTFSVPFCTWMMKGFFDTIPRTLDEAGRVDGCGHVGAYWRVVLPLARSGLLATGLFSFISGWNEYLYASVLVQRYNKWTITVGLASFVGQYSTDWAAVMAGATIITLPVLVLFVFLQRHLVSGMTAGAVKQ